jgi:hypothetical protein
MKSEATSGSICPPVSANYELPHCRPHLITSYFALFPTIVGNSV